MNNQQTIKQFTIERYNHLISDYRFWSQRQYEFDKISKSATVLRLIDANSNREFSLSEHTNTDSVKPLIPIIDGFIKGKLTYIRGEIETLCQVNNIEPPDYKYL